MRRMLFVLALAGCTDSAAGLGPTTPPSGEPPPVEAGRWFHQRLLVDAGALTGVADLRPYDGTVPARAFGSRFGPVDVSTDEAPAWTRAGADWSRTYSVRLACEGADPQACPRDARLQERLLRADPDFVPTEDDGGFVYARAGARVVRAPSGPVEWGVLGTVEVEGVLRAVGEHAGAQTIATDAAPARFRLHAEAGQSAGAWQAKVTRAVDPSTGEILAADVFVDLAWVERVGALWSEGDERSEVERAQHRANALAHMRALRRTSPEGGLGLVDRLRARPGRRLDDALAAIDAAPAQAELRDMELEYLFGPDQTLAEDLRQLWVEDRDPAGWGRGEIYPRPRDEVYDGWALLAGWPRDAATRAEVEARLATHLVLSGILRALGLEPNPAASRDMPHYPRAYWDGDGDARFASASVLDALLPTARPAATQPWPYDAAALRWLYRGEVRVFDRPVPAEVAGSDALGFAVALCGACGLQEVGAILGEPRFVPIEEAPADRRASYQACDVETAVADATVGCRLGDAGPTSRADFAARWLRWSAAHPPPRYVSPGRAVDEARPWFLARVAPTVDLVRTAARAVERLRRGGAPTGEDRDAAILGTNFLAEVVSTPRPGRYCPWPGQPRYLLPAAFVRGCDRYLDLRDPAARALGQVELTPGPARWTSPPTSDDDDYVWAPQGSLDRTILPWLASLPVDGAPSAALVDLGLSRDRLAELILAEDLFLRQETLDRFGLDFCADDAQPGLGVLLPFELLGFRPRGCEPQRVYAAPGAARDAALASRLLLTEADDVVVYRMDEPAAAEVDWDGVGFCELRYAALDLRYRAVGESSLGCGLVEAMRRSVQAQVSNDFPVARAYFGILEVARALR